MTEAKLKSVEPLMQLVLLDICNLRMHWAKLKKECPEDFRGAVFFTCDSHVCYGEIPCIDEILESMEDDIKDLVRGRGHE